ncbi:protein kinase [Lysobacter koreensis]|uniref:Protein kinase n=1 Tax=Lysobacter koreensis TaxID=266122 RepID=A0ABW2YUD3_9GAMM
MDAERWQRLSPLLDALFELDDQERAQRLRDLRDDDAALADELESLIALEDGHEDFLSEPLIPPLAALRPGSEIGPYRLERMLGEGGMGQVWLAARADGLYQRRVALKLLRPGLADPNLRLRFTRERQILARLAHPHIARLLDAGISAENLPYLALEYVEGEPITDYCRHHNTPLERRLRMFEQICDAVSHAHANLIVHRDLKPSNILVTPGGDVRLLDFGIAKLLDSDAPKVEQTRTGVRTFTLHYAAPEQIRGEPVTTMTDVYSLGVVLYELLTDAKPYRLKRQTDAEWEEAILAVDPLRPSQTVLRDAHGEAAGADPHLLRRHSRRLAGDLDNIVLKTLSKRPEQRYPSAEALSLDLQRYEAGRPVQARAQSVGYRMRKYLRRHRWALATGSFAAVVLSLALGVVAWQAREAVREAGRAQAMQDFMVGLFENAGGAPNGGGVDLRNLLDDAVERGNRELMKQPRARAELLGVVARLRSGLGDYREAHALLDRQAGIIDLTAGIPVSLRLESLTQRGEVLRQLGDPRACIDLMQPALDTARREQAQLPPQAADFYSQLGRCRGANGERRTARLLFERALALRRDAAGAQIGEVENRLDLAGLDADDGNAAAAGRNYQAARLQLRQVAGERHPLMIRIGRRLAELARQRGHHATAERELRGAFSIALEAHGSLHPTTLAVQRDLAAVLVEQGRYADAERELRDHQRVLLERYGRDHAELRDSHRALGQVEWQRGDTRAALGSLRTALAISRRGGDPAQIAESLVELAELEHGVGDDRDALPHLERARRLRSERYGANHALVGDVDRLIGEVSAALGLPDPIVARLAQAVQLTRHGYGFEHPNARTAQLSLARHQALSGDASGLVRLDALARLPESDLALRPLAWRARAYAAQVRCSGPRQPVAMQALDALLAQLQQAQREGGAITREVAAIRAGCADGASTSTASAAR